MKDTLGESGRDRARMRLALRLAGLGCGWTHPNPRVGAVAERDGQIVGLGAHLRFGGPHAEAALLAEARPADTRGATLFVNLEPCGHHGKTPPCTDAILRAGIERVVVAMEDPGPQVHGRGFEILSRAGVQVERGVGLKRALMLNAPYLWLHLRRRAFVTLKMAVSLDGRVAAADGSSRWITDRAARERVQQLRAACDAVLIGRGTLESDRPRLNARPRRDPLSDVRGRVPGAATGWPHQPARVVVDSRCSVARSEELLQRMSGADGGPWIVACGERAARSRIERCEEAGIRCWILGVGGGGAGVDLEALLQRLAREGLLDVMTEGGPTLASELVRAGLVDRLLLFQAPLLLGGKGIWLDDLGVESLSESVSLGRLTATRVGRDLLVETWMPEAAAALGTLMKTGGR